MPFKSIISDQVAHDIIADQEEQDCQHCGQTYYRKELLSTLDGELLCVECISTNLSLK